MENETFIYEQQAEDSGVEVAEQAHDPSCASSLFSENEAGSECGSETFRQSPKPRQRPTLGPKPEIKPKPTSITPTRTSSTKIKRVESMKVRGEVVNDGRWPFAPQPQRSRSKGPPESRTPPKMTMSTSMGPSSLIELKSNNTLDKYGTLPRRKKKEVREPSLNRAATLRRQQSKDKEDRERKSLPPYPGEKKGRTLIYHEVSIQTAMSFKDFQHDGLLVSDRLSGSCADVAMQTDKEHFDVETLMRLVNSQKQELQELRTYKLIAQKDLAKGAAMEMSLMKQVAELEAEHKEMLDFLQAEKSSLSESLLDADDEVTRLKELLAQRDIELAELQEKCNQLTCLSEQRREDCINLDKRLAIVEERNKAVIVEQGAAVSGAALALSGLGARLDDLVDQVSQCYHIADADLEDAVFNNEAFKNDSIGDMKYESEKGRNLAEAIYHAIRKPSIGLMSTFAIISNKDLSNFLNYDADGPFELEKKPAPKLPKEINLLVDKVIEIDNLVTKMLKIIQIVDVEKQSQIQRLSDKKTDLEDKLEGERKCNELLQKELKDVRHQLSARIMQLEEAKQMMEDNWKRESQRQYEAVDRALEKFNSMQDVVDQFPCLGTIQKQLEDCNYLTASGDDLNANNQNSTAIRTTAI